MDWEPRVDTSHGLAMRLRSGSRCERIEWIGQFLVKLDSDVIQPAKKGWSVVRFHCEGIDGRVVAQLTAAESIHPLVAEWAFFTDLDWEKSFRRLDVEAADFDSKADALYLAEAELVVSAMQAVRFPYRVAFHVYDNPTPFREVLIEG